MPRLKREMQDEQQRDKHVEIDNHCSVYYFVLYPSPMSIDQNAIIITCQLTSERIDLLCDHDWPNESFHLP